MAWGRTASDQTGFGLDWSDAASGGTDALCARPTMAGLIASKDEDELKRRRFEARLGYGFGVFSNRSTATREVGIRLSNDGREYSVGRRLGIAKSGLSSLEPRLDGTRRESANDDAPRHGVALRLNARW